MGDSDIVLNFKNEANQDSETIDFADYTQHVFPSEGADGNYVQGTANIKIYKTLVAQWGNSGYYRALMKEVDTGAWTMAIYTSSGTETNSEEYAGGFGLFVKVGGKYYTVGMGADHANNRYYINYDVRGAARPVTNGSKRSTWYEASQDDYYRWVGMRFNVDGTIDLMSGTIFNMSNYAVKQANVGRWDGAYISEHGFVGYGIGAHNYEYYLANLLIEGSDASTIAGGAATLTNLKSTVVTSALGGGGGGTIVCGYEGYDELQVLKDNILKSVTVVDDTNSNVMFKGEIKEMTIGRHKVTYTLEEAIRKLTEQKCNYNPVTYKSEILQAIDNVVYDELADWTLNEFQNKIMVIKDSSIYEYYSFPSNPVWYDYDENVVVYPKYYDNVGLEELDGTLGYISALYFDDNEQTRNIYGCYSDGRNSGSEPNFRLAMDFIQFRKDNTDWDTVDFKMIVRTIGRANNNIKYDTDNHRPKIFIYNNTTTSWDVIQILNKDDYSTSSSSDEWFSDLLNNPPFYNDGEWIERAPKLTLEFNLLEKLDVTMAEFVTDYVTVGTEPNASDFEEDSITISITTGTQNQALDAHPDIGLEIHYAHLYFTTEDQQGMEIGSSPITSNTSNSITIDDTVSYTIADYPQADGVSKGDSYSITDEIQTVLDTIFAGDWSIDYDFEADGYGETEDLIDTAKYDILQKYSESFNLAFWQKPHLTDLEVVMRKTFVSAGITLTSEDVEDWEEDAWYYTIDGNSAADRITIIGAEGIRKSYVDQTDYSLEYQHSLGDEDVLYRDSELYTARLIEEYGNSKISLHRKLHHNLEIMINLSTPNQSYATIEIGKTIALKLPTATDTSICNFTSAGDGELLIEAITFTDKEEDEDQYATLILQKRVV